jgi:hypothetical protein
LQDVDRSDNFFVYNFTLGGKLAVPGKYKVEIKFHRSLVVGDSENSDKVLQGRFVLLSPHKYKVAVTDKLVIADKIKRRL